MTTIAEQGADMAPGAGADGRVDAADAEMVRQLAERARAEGLSLTGPGGPSSTRSVIFEIVSLETSTP
jgi:hypothetical protein